MENIRCPDCDQTFCSRYNLLRHRRNKHSTEGMQSHLGVAEGPKAYMRVSQEAPGAHFGALGVHLGAPELHLGALGAHVGAQGAHLGAPSPHLGAPQGGSLPPLTRALSPSKQQRKTYNQDASPEKPTVLHHPFTMMVSGPTC